MFKYLAAFFMLIDHIAHIFAPWLPEPAVMIMRGIGRLSFPMFAYALARGYNRSSNLFNYFLRMTFFAVITQVLFALITSHYMLQEYLFQNVLITFALSLAALAGIDLIERSSMDMMIMMRPVLSEGEVTKRFSPGGIRLPAWLGTISGLFLIISALFLNYKLEPDYGLYGMLSVIIFQRIDRCETPYECSMRRDLKLRRWLICLGSFLILTLLQVYISAETYGRDFYSMMQLFSVFAVLLFPLYEREPKPGKFSKYFFYVFYPLHYCLLLILRAYLF